MKDVNEITYSTYRVANSNSVEFAVGRKMTEDVFLRTATSVDRAALFNAIFNATLEGVKVALNSIILYGDLNG